MDISGLHSAKELKFKLRLRGDNGIKSGLKDSVVYIKKIDDNPDFFVKTRDGDTEELFTADKKTARDIKELLDIEKGNGCRNLFVVEETYPNEGFIEIQSYTFASLKEYKTPITVQAPEKIVEKHDIKKLCEMFVYKGIGPDAIFALRYKDKKKTDVRLISGGKFLNITRTPRGFIIDGIDSRKDRTYLPIDIYLAPKIEFVRETNNAGNNEEFAQDIDTFSNATSYFSRWEAYNELAKKEIELRSEEFGKIPYSDCKKLTVEGGIKFIFSVKDEIEKSFLGETIGVRNEDADNAGQPRDVRVGEIIKIDDNKIETFLKRDDIVVSVPVTGSLVLSTFGDKAVIKRREKARDRMLGLRSPIKYIVPLIEEGASEYSLESNWADNKPVTDELKKNFKQAKELNPRQQKALELAINTPDIALIQGPPGTGKTTVIKAICERFKEVFARDNNGERPTILITSFQNDAVDNAVSNPLPGELPAYRIGKKSEVKFKRIVENWTKNVDSDLVKDIGGNKYFKFGEIRGRLSDAYFVYKNTGEKPEDGIRLINDYLAVHGIKYPETLKKNAEKLIDRYRRRERTNDAFITDPFITRLKEQRLTKESFKDDGAEKAERLRVLMERRSDLNIETEYIDAVRAVADNGINNDDIFIKYVKSVNALIKKHAPADERINPVLTNEIDECIQELALAFYGERLKTVDDLEAKKAIIIGEFLDRLKDEAETLIGKYSLTTAATCQYAMPLSGRNDQSFDMVIVDEAARATPLDLFIPMSMGRKIVLVGDHKQLPHMLEPDVLRLITDDPQFDDLPQLDISLFERLFTIFDSGTRPKSVLLDTQYRMHPDICRFVSEAFYENKLVSGIRAEDRVIPREIFDGKALVYINVTKRQGGETPGMSKSRGSEARYIADDIKKLLDVCPDADVGVITFYSAQTEILGKEIRNVLNDSRLKKVEWGTVDAFQGKEFDYVFLSCVRSNSFPDEKDSVGFLKKPNRICVALSRAKFQLAIYGDAQTVNAVECFKLLYEKCRDKKEGYYYEY